MLLELLPGASLQNKKKSLESFLLRVPCHFRTFLSHYAVRARVLTVPSLFNANTNKRIPPFNHHQVTASYTSKVQNSELLALTWGLQGPSGQCSQWSGFDCVKTPHLYQADYA